MQKSIDNVISSVRFPHMDAETYLDRYKLSINDRLSYWAARAEEFIDWQTMFKQVEITENGQSRWFVGGEMNVASNCLDRHLETKGDDIAIIWCAEEKELDRKISYKQLHTEVCAFANVLAAKGLKKGDVVCLYSTMLPEIIVSMLACARLGLVYEFIDLKMAEDLISEQIASAKPKLIITQDMGIRSGKRYPLFECSRKLVKKHSCIENMIIIRSVGGSLSPKNDHEFWYHDMMVEDHPDTEPAQVAADAPLFMSYVHEKQCHLGYINAGYLLYCAITQRRIFDYQDGDVFWVANNFNVVMGHALAIWGSLINGATTVLYDGDANQLNSYDFWEIVSKYDVNLLYAREEGLAKMVAADAGIIERESWKNLRVVGLGFSENKKEVIAKCQELSFDYCTVVTTTNLLNTGQILFAYATTDADVVAGGLGDPFFGIQPVLVDESSEIISADVEAKGDLKLLSSWPSQNRILYTDEDHDPLQNESGLVGQWQKNQSYINTGLSVTRDSAGHYHLLENK